MDCVMKIQLLLCLLVTSEISCRILEFKPDEQMLDTKYPEWYNCVDNMFGDEYGLNTSAYPVTNTAYVDSLFVIRSALRSWGGEIKFVTAHYKHPTESTVEYSWIFPYESTGKSSVIPTIAPPKTIRWLACFFVPRCCPDTKVLCDESNKITQFY